jgi:ABC-type amino acid transport substrate-binding protein
VQRTATPQEAIDALVKGKLDVAVSCFNLTHGRLRLVGYTTPYRFEGIKILGKAKEFDLLGILTRAIKDVRLPRAFSWLFGTTLLITFTTVILESKLVEAIFAEKLSAKNFTRLWLLITIGPSPLDKTSRLKTTTLLAFSHYVRIIFSGALIAAITAAAIGESIESDGKFTITSFSDLEGLRVGVADGSYAEALITEKLEPIHAKPSTAASTVVVKYKRIEDLADALEHDQVDVIAGDAAAIKELGSKLSTGGHYFIYAPELAKTPQGFLIAPTVSKTIDSALDDAVVSIETERSQDPKP